jgi:hypothetical protein
MKVGITKVKKWKREKKGIKYSSSVTYLKMYQHTYILFDSILMIYDLKDIER